MYVVVVLLGFVALLSGCQTSSYQGDETSPFYIVPAGSHLILNRALDFRPEQVSLYVQNGETPPINQVRHYEPHCKFELFHRVDQARTIAPDDIIVTSAHQHISDSVVARPQQRHYAGLSVGLMAQMGGLPSGGGPAFLSYITQMRLRSNEQPEVFRLHCLQRAHPGMGKHLTVAEIRRTLDPIFTLRLPASPQ